MAVEIKYVVVRKGEEKMTFASKKEADAYDKMLDMAEVFCDWLSAAPLAMEEDQREALGMFLAEHKDAVQHIVRTSKMPEAATEGTASSATVSEEPESEAVSAGVDEENPSSAKAKGPRAVKAA
ncbi:YebG family protein [Pantoea sp. MBD-2R]|uniref:YebG family protein n=1 Tax=Pantoea sp. MBD-2R TaxID=3141540 RepID=UPI003183B1C9